MSVDTTTARIRGPGNIRKKRGRNSFMSALLTRELFFLLMLLIFMSVLNSFLMIYTDGFNNDPTKGTFDTSGDGFYFTTTLLSTIGFGDITPVKTWSRCLIAVEELVVLLAAFGLVNLERL